MANDLKELYDELISNGCSRFYIIGLGGPTSDDVEALGCHNGCYEVFYMERGIKSPPIFSSTNKQEAIDFYKKQVLSIKHQHIAVATRKKRKAKSYKKLLEKKGIETMENNIPSFNYSGDTVYRIFVFNNDIKLINEIDSNLPFIDKELQ